MCLQHFRRVSRTAKRISFVVTVCPSVRMELAPTGRILMKLDILVFSENLSEKIEVPLKSDNNNGTLH